MITVTIQTCNMRDILGMNAYKHEAAKTPPCRFESCFHHDIVSDVKELIHSACPSMRPGKFFLEKHKNKIYEKVINRASCADISAYGNDRGRHSPDSDVRPFLPRMRKGRGKSVEQANT